MARLLVREGLLIQHIPRTGGTWIEQALGRMGVRVDRWLEKQPPWIPKKHALLGHYEFRFFEKIRYVAAFVRHPIAYYESVWKWLGDLDPTDFKILNRRWTWHPKRSVARLYSKDFNAWVFSVLKAEPLWYTRLVEQYVGPEGGEFCDFIGRTESLTSDFLDLLALAGYEKEVVQHSDEIVKLEPQNTRSVHVEWDEGLKEKVLETERSVVRRFYGDVQTRLFHHFDLDNLKRLQNTPD